MYIYNMLYTRDINKTTNTHEFVSPKRHEFVMGHAVIPIGPASANTYNGSRESTDDTIYIYTHRTAPHRTARQCCWSRPLLGANTWKMFFSANSLKMRFGANTVRKCAWCEHMYMLSRKAKHRITQ